MRTVTFAAVVYEAYKPPREQARATIRGPAGYALVVEYENWEKLFAYLNTFNPPLEFEIPDEIDVIRLDKRFKVV